MYWRAQNSSALVKFVSYSSSISSQCSRLDIPEPTLTPVPILRISVKASNRRPEARVPPRHIVARIENHFGFRIRRDQFARKGRDRKVRDADAVAYDGIEVFSRYFQPVRQAAFAGWASPFFDRKLVPFFETVGREDRVVAVPDMFDSERVQSLLERFGG